MPFFDTVKLVETRGVEPLTSAMPLQRSAKLSYVPKDELGIIDYELRINKLQPIAP